ncbi:MAG: amidohydrolase family protein [Desulfovermiculus sp.]|nr:amidohydrolase family protein [Desulfovermiculus sp.]
MTYQSVPDLIIHNARIHTQDPGRPHASALAVGNGRILDVGDDEQILALAHTETRIIDAKDSLLLPGLMDSHFHYQDWALGRSGLELASVSSLQEVLDQVAQAAYQAQPGEWIQGQGWNEGDWPEQRMPTRHDLDQAAPDHPVALARCDLHLFAVNSKALELAQITAQTPDPPEGLISRDEHGQPDGILKEQAIGLVKAAIPDLGRST